MKNLILYFVVLSMVLTVSCKKENEVKPQSPAVSNTIIDVEYRVEAESGNFYVTYRKPNSEGQFEIETETVTGRTVFSKSFKALSGNLFSVEASNVVAANKSVFVQLYINGVLVKEGQSYSPSQKAIAQGNY